jgi:site-specific DNA recombinase
MGNAAVYARISQDREGDAAGVERQVEDAIALAQARGFTVTDRFIDNDLSAFSGRLRPEWERLLAEIAAGNVTNVVAWASDRLYRRTIDQLTLMEAVRKAGGSILTVKDGDVNPKSAEGRMRMTILASVSEFESSRKSERVSRAAEQRAATGRPHGRPSFGWRLGPAGEWELDHDQAALVREAAARVLRGESCGTIIADWNRQGLATAAGADRWDHRALRKVLRRPANAGLRIHRDRIAGNGTWPPILDLETWEAVVSRLGARGGQRRPRRYLLTGGVACAEDGERMVGHKQKSEAYECIACHRRIDAARLDEHVTDLVLSKLTTPRLAERLAHARSDTKEGNALRDLDRAGTRLAELAAMFGAGDLDVVEYRAARSAAQDRRADAERRLSSRRSSWVLGEVLASPDGIRDIWERQGVPWRREVIRAVLERVEISPRRKPGWEPARVRPIWRT